MLDGVSRDEIASRIALTIKRCYCTQSMWARQLSNYSPSDERYGKYWKNAAVLCIVDRINPVEFIEVLFYATKPRWPEIRQIASGWAKDLYHKHKVGNAIRYVTEFDLQLQGLAQRIRQGRDLEETLRKEADEFDPLFMYATASSNGLPELAEEYAERALAKYVTSVHYDQIYRDTVPASFKEAAIRIRGEA